MHNQKIKTVKAGFLNEIDTTKGFMVWSRPGNGSVTHIMDHFHQSAYHVTRIATSHIEKSDLLTPTVEGQVLLANFIEAARQAQEINGKKLVFIFDELSNASPAGVEAFSKAVLERNVLGLELVDGAVILATGMLDPKGNPFMGDIPRTLYTQLPHYIIDFKREAA